MVLPISHQAFQQIRTAQERAIGRRLSAQHNVIAAAGAGVAAVEQEFLGGKAAGSGFFVKNLGDVDLFAPIPGGMDVHFDHTGIGRDLDDIHAGIERRRIAFDMHRDAQCLGSIFHDGQQLEIVIGGGQRRHEYAKTSVARFHRHCRAHRRIAGQVEIGGFAVDGTECCRQHFAVQAAIGAAIAIVLAAFFRRFHRRGTAAIVKVRQRRKWIGRRHEAAVLRRHMRQRIQRQAEADRAVAGQQEQMAAACRPTLGHPALQTHLHRQHITDRL